MERKHKKQNMRGICDRNWRFRLNARMRGFIKQKQYKKEHKNKDVNQLTFTACLCHECNKHNFYRSPAI